MIPIAARDILASQPMLPSIASPGDEGGGGIEIVQRDLLSVPNDRDVARVCCFEQVAHDLLLTIDRDALARKSRHIDAEQDAIKRDPGAVMHQSLPVEPFCQSKPPHQIDGSLFQHAGANPAFDIRAVALFDDYRVDPLLLQEMGEEHSRRPGSNYGDLGAQLFSPEFFSGL